MTEMTHEIRRYCSGDGAWTKWRRCTAEQAAKRTTDSSFEVRLIRAVTLCAPGDQQQQRWMLTYEDASRDHELYESEDEARAAFCRANERWNCYLWRIEERNGPESP